jgi:hypothetical protein
MLGLVKGEVLEGPNQAALDSQVANRGTYVKDIDLSVHWCGAGLTVGPGGDREQRRGDSCEEMVEREKRVRIRLIPYWIGKMEPLN